MRDRFSPTAAVLAPFWLLSRRLWLGAIAYVALAALIVGVALALDLRAGWIAVLIAALHLIVGFEAASLQRWALERRGWRTLGTVAGRTAEECERRFLEAWLDGQPVLDSRSMTPRDPALADAMKGRTLAGAAAAPRSGWRSLPWRR